MKPPEKLARESIHPTILSGHRIVLFMYLNPISPIAFRTFRLLIKTNGLKSKERRNLP
jgi:hypothetical protein